MSKKYHNSRKPVILSIVIVNYNGKTIIGDCIYSIRKYITVPYEIIVVDNFSADGSQEYLKYNFSDINLLLNETNEGFAKGNNIGVKKSIGKYILLLNNDAFLSQDIKLLIDLMESDKNIGVAGIKMYGQEGEYRHSAGFFPVAWRLFKISSLYNKKNGFSDGQFKSLKNDSPPYYEVDWVEGSFLLTRRSLWNSVGGLDDSYFMYVEDVDYCKMIKNAGFKTVYYPSLNYVHIGGYGSGRLNLIFRGFCRYHKKHSSFLHFLLAYSILLIGLCFRFFQNFLGTLSGRKNHNEKFKVYKKTLLELLKWN